MKFKKIKTPLILLATTLTVMASGTIFLDEYYSSDELGEALGIPAVFSTGSPGGAYLGTFGNNFQELLDDELGVVFDLSTSKGSEENLKRLAKDQAIFALAQKDAFIYFSAKYKDKFKRIKDDEKDETTKAEKQKWLDSIIPIAELTDECVFIAVNKNKEIQRKEDLKGVYSKAQERPFIFKGKRGSGTAITWKLITSIDPAYGSKSDDGKYLGMSKSLVKTKEDAWIKLADSNEKKMQAIMWVMDPEKKDSSEMRRIANNSNLKVIDFDDEYLQQEVTEDLILNGGKQASQTVEKVDSLEDALALFNEEEELDQNISLGSNETYQIKKVSIPGQGEVKTLCTKVVLYGHKKLTNPDVQVEDGPFWNVMVKKLLEYLPEIVNQQL